MLASDPPIIVKEWFDISAKKLWQLLTEVKHMRKWFFDNIPEFKPELGFKTAFDVEAPSQVFRHTWEIIEVKQEQRIVYDWSYPGVIGRGTVAFDLEQQDGGVKLVLTNITLEDWPQDMPEFKRESAVGGWKYFVNDRLKGYAEEIFPS